MYSNFARVYDSLMESVDRKAWLEYIISLFGDAKIERVADCACGTGALMFKHANSSGFWVTVTMSNMDIRQGIRAVGGGSTVAGFTGAAITVILHFAGII